jgi:hypothetical protein
VEAVDEVRRRRATRVAKLVIDDHYLKKQIDKLS